MGDLALTLPFQLAKKHARPIPGPWPRTSWPGSGPFPASTGWKSPAPASSISSWTRTPSSPSGRAGLGTTALRPDERKIIVEHTNINPNKAAHIGHLRNACLGDTLVRCLRFKGETVEVQNYIDDTGVQVVDVVFGFLELEKKTPGRPRSASSGFDYYCWDLYARTAAYLETDPGRPGPQGRDPEGHRARPGPEAGHGPLRLPAHPARPPGDDGPDRGHLRRPALREQHPRPEVLGAGLRPAQGEEGASTSSTTARTPAAGS